MAGPPGFEPRDLRPQRPVSLHWLSYGSHIRVLSWVAFLDFPLLKYFKVWVSRY